MPPVSQAQRRLMAAAAAGKSSKVPQSVGREFMAADPGGKLPERAQGGGEISYQKPSKAFQREHPTTSKGPVSQQQRRLVWATAHGADTQMPEAVARRFARSDAPGSLPKFVHEGKGLGKRPRAQFGGSEMMRPFSAADLPYWTRAEARQDATMDTAFPGGLIPSSLPGRTDRLPLEVPGESHIIPAQEVAGIGQGNTTAGGRLLMMALRTGPWGMKPPELRHGRGLGTGMPEPPRESRATTEPSTAPTPESESLGPSTRTRSAQAGGAPGRGTSILAAGGEFVIPREDWPARDEQGNVHMHAGVRTIGGGDVAKGHEILNRMIHNIRAHTLKFLRNAPPPKE